MALTRSRCIHPAIAVIRMCDGCEWVAEIVVVRVRDVELTYVRRQRPPMLAKPHVTTSTEMRKAGVYRNKATLRD